MNNNNILKLLTICFVFFISFSSAKLAMADIYDGLMAWYPFDGDARDASGNGNHGTVKGASLIEDKFGNNNSAYSFEDNKVDRIILPYTVMDNLLSFSISAFVALDSFNNSNNFISGARSKEDNAFIFHYNQIEIKGWRLVLDGKVYKFDSNIVMQDKNWHYVVITKDSQTVKLYIIDCEKIGNDITLPKNSINIDQGGLIIGQDQDSVGGSFETNQGWEGKIDELCFYNRALSESEVLQIYNQSTKHIYLNEGLIAHYEFENNPNDSSGNENNGTEKNGVSYINGKFGNAANFDGSSACIDIGKIISSNNISISAWIKKEKILMGGTIFLLGIVVLHCLGFMTIKLVGEVSVMNR
ncbi:MAG: hypothetical protein OMM_02514 [Candidatus Magnetoglobus multicellularis str. Araruama]|uniref:Pentraxin (PTX) domain-containing protein n=1 Tax=Candidatus Magnetoglobus multicellularis str. Araruama TaxID=890399 RepID=A0A1V1P9B2_9BACT|nr:MAG: hypothetical protein OMM_02514 [Candidatus Magnetoglobus multicellularis str. Araruama]